jgi:hypothetical protein
MTICLINSLLWPNNALLMYLAFNISAFFAAGFEQNCRLAGCFCPEEAFHA